MLFKQSATDLHTFRLSSDKLKISAQKPSRNRFHRREFFLSLLLLSQIWGDSKQFRFLFCLHHCTLALVFKIRMGGISLSNQTFLPNNKLHLQVSAYPVMRGGLKLIKLFISNFLNYADIALECWRTFSSLCNIARSFS